MTMIAHLQSCRPCRERVQELEHAPAAVRAWLEARVANDVDAEVSALCEDVVVAAEGRLFLGREEAYDWSHQALSTPGEPHALSCETRGNTSLVTLQFEGPERGSSTEVTYCFLLSGDLIRGLAVAA